MNEEIKSELRAVSKPDKAPFQARIVNTNYPLLGSSVGDIRKLAKIYKNIDLDTQEKDIYYEELLLRGFIIAYNQAPIKEKRDLIYDYLSQIDSWALCDSFCSTFKLKNDEYEELFEELKGLLNSNEEFFQRYALVMFLSHFLKLDKEGKKLRRPRTIELADVENDQEGSYIEAILELIDRPYETFYSSMGASWLGAEAFLFFPKKVIDFLKDNNLDPKTHNKLIQKIRESKNPSKEVKDYVNTLKK